MNAIDYLPAAAQPSVTDCCHREETAAERLERLWFVAAAAVDNLKGDCNTLLRAMKKAEDEWQRACAQLAEIEALRDSLSAELAAVHPSQQRDRAPWLEMASGG
jgi:hypothetical protein